MPRSHRRYDRYGVRTATLEDVVSRTQQALGLPFQARDSSYYGGTYYLYRLDSGRRLQIHNNRDPLTGELIRGECADHAVLLEVSDLDDMDEIQRALFATVPGVELLASKTLPIEPGDED